MILEEIDIVKSNQRRALRHADAPIGLYTSLGFAAAVTGLALGLVYSPTVANARPYNQRIVSNSGSIVQDDDEGDDSDISTSEIDRYVAVYKAMQNNRSLTVDQAASSQGMSLQAFRTLENRIERDEAAREQARDKLRAAASPGSSPAPSDSSGGSSAP
jgi:hypothetical protein